MEYKKSMAKTVFDKKKYVLIDKNCSFYFRGFIALHPTDFSTALLLNSAEDCKRRLQK